MKAEPKLLLQQTDDGFTKILSIDCKVSREFFLQATELLIREPNISSPSILRAEIMNEIVGIGNTREIIRKIVPKQQRDPTILQNIQIVQNQQSVQVEHFAHGIFQQDQNDWDSIRVEQCSPQDLPYFYPKFLKFRYCFQDDVISVDVKPFPGMEELVQDAKLLSVWKRILMYYRKIAIGLSNGYEKRVHHDLLVPKIEFQDYYAVLKQKYKHWVHNWEGTGTDPLKHVYEDVAIATFLILLWKKTPLNGKPLQFVDLGCGNGFLSHILTNEGYTGFGIDLWKRKQWDKFPKTRLIEKAIDCPSEVFDDVEWIIGNHPDELTLWIPIMAAKADCNFVIIPCCFHQLDGSKMTRYNQKLGRYLSYALQIEEQCKALGQKSEREYLRIPSTKNLCIVSRERAKFDVQDVISRLVKDVVFKLRKTDRQKTLEFHFSKPNLLQQDSHNEPGDEGHNE